MATGDGGTVLSDAATERDELGRGAYVRTLTRLVRGAETPLVMAIYGAWGSGKSSMMLQVRRALDPAFDVVGVRFGKLRDVRDELRAREFEQREERTRLRQHFRAALEAAGAGQQRVVVFIDDSTAAAPSRRCGCSSR